MDKITKKKKVSATRILVFSIIITIFIGTILLKLPICNNKKISWLDSLFTTTSAVSVTGLTTINISEQFNVLGKVIILMLIQIGGLRFHDLYFSYINFYRKKN